jgi:cell division protein FtsZ
MKKAKGEFIATVDSDSIVEKTTLKKLVQPFANKKIGAVAGTITGKNCATNSHVCMLDVMLIFGCEFLRKAQSVTGNVFCTPGALSCYRKSAILPVIDQWLGQTFLGVEARIGEDRAIEAAKQAVSSPLLETTIDGATDAIINITGGNSLTLFEAEDAAEVVRNAANTDINTIFGAVINENLNDEVIVTVIATGFDDAREQIGGLDNDLPKNPSYMSREDDFDDIPPFLRNRDDF